MLNLSNGALPSAVAEACDGKLNFEGNKRSTHAVIDSRAASSGSIFFAIKGERTDGHLYLSSAADKGASAVITEKTPEDMSAFELIGCSVILVNNSAESLALLAKRHKKEMKALTLPMFHIRHYRKNEHHDRQTPLNFHLKKAILQI